MSLSATQLRLFIDSSPKLFKMKKDAWIRLARRKTRRDYNTEIGWRTFRAVVNQGALEYVQNLGIKEKWRSAFPPADREATARTFEREFRERYRRGDLDHLLPPKMRKARASGTIMPGGTLRTGYDRETIRYNLTTLIATGSEANQATATALAHARNDFHATHPGKAIPALLREVPKRRASKNARPPSDELVIAHGAIRNTRGEEYGWLPQVWEGDRPTLSSFAARGVSKAEAVAGAKLVADERAARFVGDWSVTLVEREEEKKAGTKRKPAKKKTTAKRKPAKKKAAKRKPAKKKAAKRKPAKKKAAKRKRFTGTAGRRGGVESMTAKQLVRHATRRGRVLPPAQAAKKLLLLLKFLKAYDSGLSVTDALAKTTSNTNDVLAVVRGLDREAYDAIKEAGDEDAIDVIELITAIVGDGR